MRPPAVLLLIPMMLVAMAAALAGCSEVATAKIETTLRSTAGNDGKIVARIPQLSTVKLSKCAQGWCQVSWNGQHGYALAKNFSVAGLANSANETDADDDNPEGGSDD